VTPSAAAELVTAGFNGRTAAEAPLDALAALAPGAIVLFARNVGTPDDLRELVAALRATQPLPPLIAIDQEGGRVARIVDGVAALPPAMAVGAAGDPDACERLGVLAGRDLARFGISVDYAPVGDCAVDAGNTVIGTRAYGSDPYRVAQFASAFARGLAAGASHRRSSTSPATARPRSTRTSRCRTCASTSGRCARATSCRSPPRSPPTRCRS
jgi:beta-N-acetylhexosaminidase